MNLNKLKEQLVYNPSTGYFTRVLKRGRSKKPAGSLNSKGYIIINSVGAHRLAWLFTHGRIKEGNVIDHINHDRSDNRICNLREVSHSENMRNRIGKLSKDKSGLWVVTAAGKLIGKYFKEEEALRIKALANKKYGYHENHFKDIPKEIKVPKLKYVNGIYIF